MPDAGPHGAAGLRNVYTRRHPLEAHRITGKLPDGTAFVRELRTTKTARMTTWIANRGNATEGWFIMAGDTEGRFEGGPLLGERLELGNARRGKQPEDRELQNRLHGSSSTGEADRLDLHRRLSPAGGGARRMSDKRLVGVVLFEGFELLARISQIVA